MVAGVPFHQEQEPIFSFEVSVLTGFLYVSLVLFHADCLGRTETLVLKFRRGYTCVRSNWTPYRFASSNLGSVSG